MTWVKENLYDKHGNKIGAAFKSGNCYSGIVVFKGQTHYIAKTITWALAKESVETWWRDIQEVEL